MADPSNADDLRYLPTGAAPKRKSSPNMSSGWIAMLLSGLIAAVVFLYVTNQTAQRFTVAVIAGNLAVGQRLDPATLRHAMVNVEKDQLDKLVLFEDRAQYDGWVVAAPLETGDLLPKSAVRPPSATDGLRAMSVPVDRSRAVAGALRAGDRVDIIDTVSGFPGNFAGRNLQVLAVNQGEGRAALAGGGGEFSLTVGVTAEEAVNVSRAIAGGKFDVVRSTGATPVAPATSGSGVAGSSGTGTGLGGGTGGGGLR